MDKVRNYKKRSPGAHGEELYFDLRGDVIGEETVLFNMRLALKEVLRSAEPGEIVSIKITTTPKV